MEPNLIVTYPPTRAAKARQEIESLLKEFSFLDSDHDGVFLLRTKHDPKSVVADLARRCSDEPYLFNSTFRWIPVETWSEAKMEDMKKTAKETGEKIEPRDTWKMSINKRSFPADTPSILSQLTEEIDKPNVDLKSPAKIIAVEIIGGKAGFSLLRPDEYLSVSRIRNE